MKGRSKRNNQARKKFQVCDMLGRKVKNSTNDPPSRSKFLTLTFLGFEDPSKGNKLYTVFIFSEPS